MPDGMFVQRDDGELVEITQSEFESEDLFQKLLVDHPELIPSGQMGNSVPRRWLLIAREAGIPGQEGGSGRWWLDHLFVDQDGIPTLVEVKRSTDTRIRREVVAQMLDYAANSVEYLTVESIYAAFDKTCEEQGISPDQTLETFLEDTLSSEQFWATIKTNLQAGKIRLLFIADVIPPELERIVEFLNRQMDPAIVLAVEIRQFIGEDLKSYAPRVLGQTTAAIQRKSSTRNSRQWDEESFLVALVDKNGADAKIVVDQLLEWSKANMCRDTWGQGVKDGSYVPAIDYGGETLAPIAIYTYGRVEIQFQHMRRHSVFADEAKRKLLLARLNSIDGISLPEDSFNRRPSIPILDLAPENVWSGFEETLDWIVTQLARSRRNI